MVRFRRSVVVAFAAFLLAFVPATTSARAQLVRWLELDADPAVDVAVRIRVMIGSRTLRSDRILPVRRAEIQRARFVGSAGEVDLAGQILDYQTRLLALPVPLLNQTPGWVAVDMNPTEAEMSADRWRAFLAAEGLLSTMPPRDAAPVRVRSRPFFKLLVHRRNGAPNQAVTRPVGQTLELVPLEDPATMTGNLLKVQVLFQGKPLAGAHIFAAPETAFGTSTASTDAEGRAVLTLNGLGNWVLRTARVDAIAATGTEVMVSIVTLTRR